MTPKELLTKICFGSPEAPEALMKIDQSVAVAQMQMRTPLTVEILEKNGLQKLPYRCNEWRIRKMRDEFVANWEVNVFVKGDSYYLAATNYDHDGLDDSFINHIVSNVFDFNFALSAIGIYFQITKL